ncbi:MAG: transcriptional regulator [Acidobacteria bacterium]|nr:transcriptional regulator [Acidobacteriota bacterium]NIQ84437.1 transcriptional regulator [Acidobacteriota bacterium]
MNPLQILVRQIGRAELARRCGVSARAVRKWEEGRVPAERVGALVDESNGRFIPWDFRPDVFARADVGARPSLDPERPAPR